MSKNAVQNQITRLETALNNLNTNEPLKASHLDQLVFDLMREIFKASAQSRSTFSTQQVEIRKQWHAAVEKQSKSCMSKGTIVAQAFTAIFSVVAGALGVSTKTENVAKLFSGLSSAGTPVTGILQAKQDKEKTLKSALTQFIQQDDQRNSAAEQAQDRAAADLKRSIDEIDAARKAAGQAVAG